MTTLEKQSDYFDLVQKVLSVDKAVRFCGVIDKLGHLVYKKYRADIEQPVLSEEENARYALFTTIRRRPNLPWSDKVGKTRYFLLRNDNLVQATIPLSDSHLLLVYLETNTDSNYDAIIMKKILPMIKEI